MQTKALRTIAPLRLAVRGEMEGGVKALVY